LSKQNTICIVIAHNEAIHKLLCMWQTLRAL
jgi:hypothetical protein